MTFTSADFCFHRRRSRRRCHQTAFVWASLMFLLLLYLACDRRCSVALSPRTVPPTGPAASTGDRTAKCQRSPDDPEMKIEYIERNCIFLHQQRVRDPVLGTNNDSPFHDRRHPVESGVGYCEA